MKGDGDEMAIFTSRFSNPELKKGIYKTVRISIGKPRWEVGYRLDAEISDLMPFGLKGEALEVFKRAYVSKLEKIGFEKIKAHLEQLQEDGKDVVLLCYEDIRKPEAWCHRTMFADWWHKMTGETIEELPDPTDAATVKPSKESTSGIMPSMQLTLFGT